MFLPNFRDFLSLGFTYRIGCDIISSNKLKGETQVTAYYYTFGCKVNQYETDCLTELMSARGHIPVSDSKLADIIIINTCTVTGSADIKLKQLLHRTRRENPGSVIAVCGCFPQIYGDSPLLSLADIIAGENNKSELPSLIEEFLRDGKRRKSVVPHTKGEIIEHLSLERGSGKTRAIIKIQDGCDRFCSYCAISYARGRSRSKPLREISDEAKRLVDSGHKELVLVGINLSCYGLDLAEKPDLADAVSAVCRESGAQRVRLGSIEPEMLTADIIERLSRESKLCPQFHLSLQSGCDKTLREMRRKYDKAEYLTLVNELRKRFTDCAITTDVMTGFAGETEEDFRESLEFVKSVGFSKVHVFPYSEREGTAAAKRSDQVPINIRLERAKIMTESAKESEKEYLESLVGKSYEVLFERERGDGWHQGHTRSYVLVKVKCFTDSLWREMRNVRIISAEDGYCIGEIE